jgi:hypothetical protein
MGNVLYFDLKSNIVIVILYFYLIIFNKSENNCFFINVVFIFIINISITSNNLCLNDYKSIFYEKNDVFL